VEDLDALKTLVASHLSVVVPEGIGFQAKGSALEGLSEIQSSPGPVGVTVDGHAVREVPGPKGLPFVGSYFEGAEAARKTA
jgi:hypothetical protein